jgi:hypothetical protein
MSLACQYGYLSLLSLQTLPEPDAGHRESGRNGGSDAGERSLARLLPGNDLCGLPRRSHPGQRGFGDPAVLDDEILQIPTRRAATGISRWPEREGIMSSTFNEPRSSALATRSGVVRSSTSAGSASRCLAVSIAWRHVEPGSPPQTV